MSLVLLALLPAFGVIFYQVQVQRSNIQQGVTEQTLSLAFQARDAKSQAIRESQPLLSTLAQLFAIAGTPLEEINLDACHKFLASIRPDGSAYANLGVIARDGALICSALPFTAPLNLADRAYFQGALETRDFFIGDFQVGRATGLATINTGMPILDASGQVKGVVFAALDLGVLSRLAEETSLPPGTVINVVDRNGRVLMRHPNPEGWIGQAYPEATIIELSLASSGPGTARAPGLDGVDRLYSFAPLVESLGPESPMIIVGIPAAVAFADVDRALVRNLAIMVITGLLALAATWLAGDLFVLRRVRALVNTAQRLTAGDLDARSGLAHGAGEISRLAGAFDDMAAALQSRLAELQESREKLRELAEEEAALAELGRIISSSIDINEVYASFAEQVRQLIPWDRISVSLVDLEAGTLVSTYQRGVALPERELGAVSPLPGSLTQEMVKTHAGLLVRATDDAENKRKYPTLARSVHAGLRCFIAVPLVANDQVIGALHLQSLESGAYTERHLKLAEGVGTQIAGAIASARLHQLRQQGEEDLRAAEQKARDRAAELARSNAELEQFAYIASHDLQEPLRSITGFTSLLSRRYRGQLGDDADRFITRITDATARMQRLINDLLTYSRVGREIGLQHTDCNRLVQQEISSMQATIREAEAVVRCNPLPTVMADPTLLGQVFRNLMANAIKFRGQEPPTVHISAEQKGTNWVLAVRDNGIGIDPEYRERIFTIFERLHSVEEYPGTGIGLSICQKAVECWGGRIWVESVPGSGSTFYFTVPITPVGAGQSPHLAPSSGEREGDLAAVTSRTTNLEGKI